MRHNLTTTTEAMRQLVRKLSATPKGFALKDGDRLNPAYCLASQVCSAIIRTGELFRVHVKGHPFRYFSTEAAGLAWSAETPERKAPRKKIPKKDGPLTSNDKGALLLKTIMQYAETPDGFSFDNRPDVIRLDSASRRCCELVADGRLFLARTEQGFTRYFDTKEAANACREAFLQRKKSRTIERKKAFKKPVPIVIRKPYSPPAPRKDAEIVHTANTRYSSNMMPDRYSVSVPYQRIGTAGWLKPIGSATAITLGATQ